MKSKSTTVYRGGRSLNRIPRATTEVEYSIEKAFGAQKGSLRADFDLGPKHRGTHIIMNVGHRDLALVLRLIGKEIGRDSEDGAATIKLAAEVIERHDPGI